MKIRFRGNPDSVYACLGFAHGSRTELGRIDRCGNIMICEAKDYEIYIPRLDQWKDVRNALADLDIAVSACCGQITEMWVTDDRHYPEWGMGAAG